MTESFRNRTFSTPRHAPTRVYPVGQWHHKRDGVVGGLEIPTRYFPDTALTLPDPIEIPHGPRTEAAWLLPSFHLAIAGLRPILWERRRGEIVEVAPAELAKPWKLGYRSRRRLLVVVKELWEAGYQDFLVATFRATASQDVGQLLLAADRFRMCAGQTDEGNAFPEYAFWIPVRAGEPKEVSNRDGSRSSQVSPIECLLPEQPAGEDFEALVISLEVQTFIEARLDEVEAWERQEDTDGSPWPANGSTAATGETKEVTPPPARSSHPEESRRRSPRHPGAHKANGDGVPNDALRVPAPIGTKRRPDYQGQALGDLLQEREGRRLVRYLAAKFRPQDAAGVMAKKAAQALVAAGLAG